MSMNIRPPYTDVCPTLELSPEAVRSSIFGQQLPEAPV
jgi:hypothetical protein